MDNKHFSLSKLNLILIAIAFFIIVLGFILMTGISSGEVYNPNIFAPRYITVGPMISFLGFILMVFAILYKEKTKN